MKRVLFVCAGNDFPLGAFNFLQSLHQTDSVSVTGLFFSPLDLEQTIAISNIPVASPYLRIKDREQQSVNANKALFARQCELNHINIDQPNQYLQEALHASECPVMILPEDFTGFGHLFIAYDGSKESVFAIKQFCYLFPQYTDLPTEIIYVNEENSDTIPDIDNLRSYSCLHFESLNFAKLHFRAAKYFATWIGEKENPLLVSGAFGRSPFSYVARRSFVEDILHDHHMPVFIAHGIYDQSNPGPKAIFVKNSLCKITSRKGTRKLLHKHPRSKKICWKPL